MSKHSWSLGFLLLGIFFLVAGVSRHNLVSIGLSVFGFGAFIFLGEMEIKEIRDRLSEIEAKWSEVNERLREHDERCAMDASREV